MAIPASYIAEVLPRVITAGSTDLELNGLFITDSAYISASTLVLSFNSLDSVRDYFGVDSTEYVVADIYFASYDNKFVAPKAIYFALRVADDIAAWLRSAKIALTVAQIKAITDGGLVISIDGTAYNVGDINFNTINSYSDAATVLQTALQEDLAGVTVTYDSFKGAFTITSPTTGAASSITFGASPPDGEDLATAFGLTAALGAVLSEGMDAMSVNEQMDAILGVTRNFVSFTTTWMPEVEEAITWASWVTTNYGYLYVPYSDLPIMLSADSDQDLASQMVAGGYNYTATMYGSLEYATFMIAVIASVPWQRINGTITMAFKRQTGLAPLVIKASDADTLVSKRCNYMGNYATRNAEFILQFPGILAAGDYGYIDPYINSVWFNNRLQVSLMDGITNAGRVPYNERGYTMIKAWMLDPINDAKNNGAIEAGVTLSERQVSEIMNEAGLNIKDELWTQGYYTQVLDPGAAIRAQRGSPIISIWYTYGGAVHKLEVASTAIL